MVTLYVEAGGIFQCFDVWMYCHGYVSFVRSVLFMCKQMCTSCCPAKSMTICRHQNNWLVGLTTVSRLGKASYCSSVSLCHSLSSIDETFGKYEPMQGSLNEELELGSSRRYSSPCLKQYKGTQDALRTTVKPKVQVLPLYVIENYVVHLSE